MFAIALTLLLAAIVTLGIGFVQEGLTLVFVSIGASVAAGIFLVLDVLRTRPAEAGAALGFAPEADDVPPADAGMSVEDPGPPEDRPRPERPTD